MLREHNGMEPEPLDAEIPPNFKAGQPAGNSPADIDFFHMVKPTTRSTDDFPNLL